jgi:hypothetical protein
MALLLDIETPTVFKKGDRRPRETQLKEMTFGIAVTYDDEADEYKEWGITDLPALWAYMQGKVICGWNIVSFDIPVIRYTLQGDGYPAFETLMAWDLFLQIREKTGRWYGLEQIALENVGRGKSADGLQAARWLQEWLSTQDPDLLRKAFNYCRGDVELEYALYAHLKAGKPLKLPPLVGKGTNETFYYQPDGRITDE